jgi:hypothetical protein
MAFPELCEAGVTVNDGKRPSCFGHKSAGFCFFFVMATNGEVLGPGQPFELEAARLAGGGSLTHWYPASDHPSGWRDRGTAVHGCSRPRSRRGVRIPTTKATRLTDDGGSSGRNLWCGILRAGFWNMRMTPRAGRRNRWCSLRAHVVRRPDSQRTSIALHDIVRRLPGITLHLVAVSSLSNPVTDLMQRRI